MQARMNYRKAAPKALELVDHLHDAVEASGLGEILMNLVYLRVSQINGCAYCVDMHSKDLRALGETDERLYGVSVWRETPFYTERERAALNWAEAVTLVAQTHVPDEVFEDVRQHFTDEEMVHLTLMVSTINVYNRFGVAFRNVPGRYISKLSPLAVQS
jgi:AhpD family alkylhydroperoxidase